MNTQDSICCGATINYQDFCSECGEHTGAIQFEDAAGEPVTQYVQPDGMLSDTPERYAVNYISHYSGKVLQTRDYKRLGDAVDHCNELREGGYQAEVVRINESKVAPEWRSEAGCCNECFVTSHDVPRGDFSMVAVPEGCGDEECDCHQFEPSVKAFIQDAPNHALAAVCVLMIFLCGAALIVLAGGAQ